MKWPRFTRRQFLAQTATAVTVAAGVASLPVCGEAAEPGASSQRMVRWPFESRSGQFFIHADYDARRRATLFTQLSALRGELNQQLQIDIHDEPIHLILFGRKTEYRGYLKLHFPKIPSRQALFVKRRGPGMVFAYENRHMAVDLRHETTHALLNASLPYVPLWLDEGLAEYFEVEADRRIDGSEHLRAIKLRALISQVPEPTTLEAIGSVAEMRPAAYRDAWAWVHFLLHESDQSRQILTRFLQELQAHSPPGSLARRIAADMPDYRARLVEHFR